MDRNTFIGIWALLMVPLAAFMGIAGMIIGVGVILLLGIGSKEG
jgi:hypothetical protein